MYKQIFFFDRSSSTRNTARDNKALPASESTCAGATPRTPQTPVGIVRDVVIENIYTDRVVKSKIFGLPRPDGTKSVRNIAFNNYRVNGQCITDPKILKIDMEGNCEPAKVVCESQ